MTAGQQERQARRKRNNSAKRRSGSLIAHGAFAPLLGLWGAALGGLVVMVLPGALIAPIMAQTALVAWSAQAQPVLAGLAALVLGGALFAVAAMLTRRARRANKDLVAELLVRRVRPINPLRDLGSRSLDEPITTMPFAAPAWQSDPTISERAAPAMSEPEPAPDMPAPRELDLAQFAEMPGRNAVWVEEPPASAERAAPGEPAALAEAAPAPVAYAPVSELRAPTPRRAEPGTAALARLRAVPPSELSLAEMVERFAGALHHQRSTASGKTLSAQELAAREAALAEALKALSALSSDGAAPVQGEPLRAALARLQGLRGAA